MYVESDVLFRVFRAALPAGPQGQGRTLRGCSGHRNPIREGGGALVGDLTELRGTARSDRSHTNRLVGPLWNFSCL